MLSIFSRQRSLVRGRQTSAPVCICTDVDAAARPECASASPRRQVQQAHVPQTLHCRYTAGGEVGFRTARVEAQQLVVLTTRRRSDSLRFCMPLSAPASTRYETKDDDVRRTRSFLPLFPSFLLALTGFNQNPPLNRETLKAKAEEHLRETLDPSIFLPK